MKKEYHLLPSYQYAYVVATLAPALLIGAYVVMHIYFDFFGLCLLLPMMLLTFLAMINSFQNILAHPYRRIIISEHGIEYTNRHIAFKTKWDALDRIRKHWSFLGRLEGSAIDVTKIEFTEGANGEFLTLFRNTFIPLSCFAKDWHNSEIGQQIKQYAPHLFH